VDFQSSFINLCNSSDEDGMPIISLCPSESSLQMSHFPFVSLDSPFSNTNISFVGGPFVFNVVDHLKTISIATHASSNLRDLNYDNFHIEIVPCIPTMFDGDVIFELPPPCES